MTSTLTRQSWVRAGGAQIEKGDDVMTRQRDRDLALVVGSHHFEFERFQGCCFEELEEPISQSWVSPVARGVGGTVGEEAFENLQEVSVALLVVATVESHR